MVKMIVLAAAVCALGVGAANAEDINPVVGKTGDLVVRQTDLERFVANQPAEVQKQLQSDAARAEFARQLLLTRAVADRARKEGFDRKPEVKEELSFAIDRFIAGAYLRKVVTAGAAVSDEEVAKYYAEHAREYAVPAKVTARHIFFAAGKDAPAAARDAARTKADAVRAQLDKGGDFAKLAAENSDDKDSAAKGGELGIVQPGRTNSEAFEKALFALKAGETSPVVETPFGFHIIRVTERTEQRTATLEETRDYIRELLVRQAEQEKAARFLEKLEKEAVTVAAPSESGAPAPAAATTGKQ